MKIGVVGAGLMGTEIALVFALGGFDVVLFDRDAEAIDQATDRIATLLTRLTKAGNDRAGTPSEVQAHIRASATIDALSPCGFVTEAVFEDIAVKSQVLRMIDEVCGAECVIASNTSTLPISSLGMAMPEPRRARFLGTHYFSPVSRMALVEVIPAFETAPETVGLAIDLMEAIGKTPIRVKDVAGFAVNRMLHAMLIEAVKLVEEGVASPEDLDTACRLGLGHPIGPFALMDVVTSSLTLQVQEILHDAYGERFRPPPLLKQRVAGGYRGGRGAPGWLVGRG